MSYKIKINGETVWESEGDQRLINEIRVATPRGDAALIRVPPEEETLDLFVDYRSLVNVPIDLLDIAKRDERVSEALHDIFGGPEISEGNTTSPGQGAWVESDPNALREQEEREKAAAQNQQPETNNNQETNLEGLDLDSENDDQSETVTY